MEHLGLSRRSFLRGAAVTGGLLVAMRGGVPGRLLSARADEAASRTSRLFPDRPGERVQRLVHADMHNHSLFSDGAGDPSTFYTTVRGNGLDVASLTDHSTVQWAPGQPRGVNICAPVPPDQASDCQSLAGMTEDAWVDTAAFADAVNVDGLAGTADDDDPPFTAIRGFEWSSPTLGHSNVWFSERWIDPLHTGGVSSATTAADFIHANAPFPDPIFGETSDAINAAIDAAGPPGTPGMEGYYQWLTRAADTPAVEGGMDGIFGFNHPGREPSRFDEFSFESAVADRCVSIEMMNRTEDYLFEGTDQDRENPLQRCLDRGWRPGILGVTDEHGTDWGGEVGKGRGGVWVDGYTRQDVRVGLERRSFFATRQQGLRVDGAANGVRMGTAFDHPAGPILIQLDIERGSASHGRTLLAQVLVSNQDGGLLPRVLMTHEFTVRTPSQPVVEFTVDVDPDVVGDWMVVRITDPEGTFAEESDSPDGRATGEYIEAGYAIAYLSPWWFDPTAAAAPPDKRAPGTIDPDPDPEPGPTETETETETASPSASDSPSPSESPSASASPTATMAPTSRPTSPPADGSPPARVRRFSGPSRFDTAVDVTRNTNAAGLPLVYVATGLDFPDALAVGSRAGRENAPVLLTRTDGLDAVVAEELRRLRPGRIVVLGGTVAVGDAVVRELDRIAPTTRLFGEDRYATAVAITSATESGIDVVWVASGVSFPDALAAGPAAARGGDPLLLTRPDAVPPVVMDELRRLRPKAIRVVGGPSAVQDGVLLMLRQVAPTSRLAGADRAATAAAISEASFPNADVVLVTTGTSFPDALAAGPAAAVRQAPLLLVTRDAIPAATESELNRLAPREIIIVGGPEAVSERVEQELAARGTR